jgi:hypothetical protein
VATRTRLRSGRSSPSQSTRSFRRWRRSSGPVSPEEPRPVPAKRRRGTFGVGGDDDDGALNGGQIPHSLSRSDPGHDDPDSPRRSLDLASGHVPPPLKRNVTWHAGLAIMEAAHFPPVPLSPHSAHPLLHLSPPGSPGFDASPRPSASSSRALLTGGSSITLVDLPFAYEPRKDDDDDFRALAPIVEVDRASRRMASVASLPRLTLGRLWVRLALLARASARSYAKSARRWQIRMPSGRRGRRRRRLASPPRREGRGFRG